MRALFPLSAVVLALAIAGCERNEKEIEVIPDDLGSVKALVKNLDGSLGLSLNGSDTTYAFGQQSSLMVVFDQLLRTGQAVNIDIVAQPEQSYCALQEDQDMTYDRDANASFLVFCQAYGRRVGNVQSVDISNTHSCAIWDDSFGCYSESTTRLGAAPAGLTNPQILKAGDGFSCAVQAEQLYCWGDDDQEILAHMPPEIVGGVKELELGFESACLIDDEGLKCWGDESIGITTEYPMDLTSPNHLVVKGTNACVLDEGVPYCWGYNFDQELTPSDLTSVIDIDLSVFQACAV